jgi:serine/threonine protein kinase
LDEDGQENPAKYTMKADIWAIGSIIMEIATMNKYTVFGKGVKGDFAVMSFANGDISNLRLIKASDNSLLARATYCRKQKRNVALWEQLNSIIRSCVMVNPSERPTVRELVEQIKGFRDGLL